MKFFLVLVAALAVVGARKVDVVNDVVKRLQSLKDSENSSEELKDMVNEFKGQLKEVSGQLELQVCKRNGTKIYDAIHKTIDCVKSTTTEGLLCDSYNAEFKKCIKPIEEVFEGCLESKFHDLPKLLIDTISSTFEYLCNAQGKVIIELWNPCGHREHEQLKDCFKSLETKFDDIEKVTNVKSTLCESLKASKTCYLNEINKSCKHELTKKSFADFYEALIIKPCSL